MRRRSLERLSLRRKAGKGSTSFSVRHRRRSGLGTIVKTHTAFDRIVGFVLPRAQLRAPVDDGLLALARLIDDLDKADAGLAPACKISVS